MDIRQLRFFIAVAEELNFRRAAEKSHITQPALSRRIKALEEELGVSLFERDKRNVFLTPAGTQFIKAARQGLNTIDAGVRELKHLSDTGAGLTVGYVEYANFPFVPKVFKRFRDHYPNVRVTQRELNPTEQIRLLKEGALDVSFTGLPLRDDALAYQAIMRSRWKLAVSSEHPLNAKAEIGTPDLDDEPIILFPRFINPGLYDWIGRCFEKGGSSLRVIQEPTQLHTALNLVAEGVGVMPSPFFIESVSQGVKFLPLKGFGPGAEIVAAYRKKDKSFVLKAFLEVVAEINEALR